MTRVRARGEDVRRFILERIEKSPGEVSKAASDKFGITRQAVNKHLLRLVHEGAITQAGNTRSKTYQLAPLSEWTAAYDIKPGLAEDVVWTQQVKPVLGALPDNVSEIWHYGFTEMFNNAIDHSDGSTIVVGIKKTATTSQMLVIDNGVGIFRKIQAAVGLLDERHSVLELAKGKLTTDPARHTGEGIFFSSRMFDHFAILSGTVYFSHEFGNPEDWITELERESAGTGTIVVMKLNNHTARTTRKVFDEFTSGDNYGFTKTVVPVRLAQYGDDKLISRSQAKRLLTRVEQFRTVLLNFEGVESIGPAFADEIFRVFPAHHPNVEMMHIRANSAVKRMIERVRSG